MNQVQDNHENADATRKNVKPQKEKKVKNKPQNDEKHTSATLEGTPNNKLTEKQLRKLEWEKKLAELKQKGDVKDGNENLSKAEQKAKRREGQEAQRQAKADKAKTNELQKAPEKVKSPETKTEVQSPEPKKYPLKKKVETKPKSEHVQLVQHLYLKPNIEYSSKIVNFKDVHPTFVKLGVQYSEKVILGSNARCLALLAAIKILIRDLQTPPKQEFCRYIEGVLQTCTHYLQECRPFAVSMTNALKFFKLQLTRTDVNLTDNDKKVILIDFIDEYINNDIKKAWDAICMKVNKKIVNEDVILIYGCSSLVRNILIQAKKDGKKFSVIIVDSRPLLEGREMLRRLVSAGIKCTYVLINALSFVMDKATKVLLGAHALLANGSVMSRIGTAQVALVAQAYNKPVLVCCEKYKFCEKVQTDSFVYNEIGNSDSLLKIDTSSAPSPLSPLKENSKLNILSLLYDVTPPDLVTAVVTELAILPCTSVPVVLRITRENDDNA